MPLTPTTALAIWSRAAAAEIGVGIKTNDKRSLQNMLYTVRQNSGDASLDNLVIVLPKEPEDEVWIVKRQVEMPSDA